MFTVFNWYKQLFSSKSHTLHLKQRVFNNRFFINEAYNDIINQNGYIVIENIVPKTQLESLTERFHKLTNFPEYSINDKFQNSGRYQSSEIRSFVMNTIEEFSKNFLSTLFKQDVYDENTTGAFQIKPPSKVSELNPHQDAPVIDETNTNGLFVWIPLCDINKKNGAVSVLTGSHLWGNHQRSLNVQWALEPHTKLLLKNMQPIYLKKGDILVWDTAMLHASEPNFSNDIRVAITTTILPKHFKMVEYVKDKHTPNDKVEKYEVERSFWESCNIMERPPCPPNIFLGYEDLAFPLTISKKQF